MGEGFRRFWFCMHVMMLKGSVVLENLRQTRAFLVQMDQRLAPLERLELARQNARGFCGVAKAGTRNMSKMLKRWA